MNLLDSKACLVFWNVSTRNNNAKFNEKPNLEIARSDLMQPSVEVGVPTVCCLLQFSFKGDGQYRTFKSAICWQPY